MLKKIMHKIDATLSGGMIRLGSFMGRKIRDLDYKIYVAELLSNLADKYPEMCDVLREEANIDPLVEADRILHISSRDIDFRKKK